MIKIKATRAVYKWRVFRGLVYILKRMLNPLITLMHTRAHTRTHVHTRAYVAYIYVTMRHVHMLPHDDRSLHTMPTATSAHDKNDDFFIFQNPNKSKISLEKFKKILEKSLNIRKFITFKIQLQINPNLFFLDQKFSIYHFKKSNIINN